jgi:signal transduction histidine kinase
LVVATRSGTGGTGTGAGPGGEPPARPGRPQPSPALRQVTVPIGVALATAVTVSVAVRLPSLPAAEIALGAAALLVLDGGVAWMAAARARTETKDLAVLAAIGLAGAVLLSKGAGEGSAVVYLALAGLGMLVSPLPALITGVMIFAAANLAFLIAGTTSLSSGVSQDLGAAFVFAIGAFTRSSRISQDRARAAQARAEDLLAQLRASQAAQAEAAALTERARLAREIHDILAHALSGLVLALDSMELLGRRGRADADTMARMQEQVARAQRTARDGLANTRRAIAALRGDELPGPALLDRLVRETAEATSIKAALTVTGDHRPLPPEIGLALYRTAQEALTNTAKYAGPDGRAEVQLSYHDHDVELVVEDVRQDRADDPAPAGLTFGGYGLTGMRERAELLGGRLTAGPTGTGFRVALWLPTGQAGPVPDAEVRP